MVIENMSFPKFMVGFEEALKNIFSDEHIHKLSMAGGLPSLIKTEIMPLRPLDIAIPKEYGGLGGKVKEFLAMLSAASYESLPLSLAMGINIGLFIEPVLKYASADVKGPIFDRFIKEQSLGGMMITEPNHGSNALHMQTSHIAHPGFYEVKGTKHWQGLTGLADFWLIASRNKTAAGDLGRDVDFFICDVHKEKQAIKVVEYYDTPGLHMIPYGRNELDLQIPKEFKLRHETSGVKMMLDILHRSRMQFPAMGMGFIKRMLDEAIDHCKNRMVGGSSLLAMDHIQYQLATIQSAYTMCSAMCIRSCKVSSIDHNLAGEGFEANSMKTVVSDLMQESAQLLVQMSGASGYKASHIGGRGIMDSRPFQIFEGSNEMLYTQIGDMACRMMKKQEENNLFAFLKLNTLTQKASPYFKKELSFTIDQSLSHRKLVDLGKIISRIICLGHVIDAGENGFRSDLVTNCISTVKQQVAKLICSLGSDNQADAIYNYEEDSYWLNFA